jgi:arylsulfatase
MAPLQAVAAENASRPNILLILADDMGYSDLGCYGGEVRTTNLDKLAANGLRFTQFYNGARCCPTRAALLTGLYAHQTGVGHMVDDRGRDGYRGELNRRCVTLAEVLKPAGYRCYMAGKWHVTRHTKGDGPKDNWPLQRGFEKFYGLLGSVRSYYDPPTLTRDNEPTRADAKDYYLTDAITASALDYLGESGKGKDPFFLYVAYTAPHWPLHALPEDVVRYRHIYREGWEEKRAKRHARQLDLDLVDKRWLMSPRDPEAPAWNKVGRKDWQIERMAVYAAMIERMDRGIGRIVDKLRASGQLDNTMIVFLSDNGGCAETIEAAWRGSMFPEKTRDGKATRVGNDSSAMPGPADVFQSYGLPWANVSNTPFREYKHWVHEGGIATPFIVHWPARIKAKGELRRQVGHTIDLMPTCVEAAGAKYPARHNGEAILPMEGKSLLPAFDGKEIERDALYWEHEGNRAMRARKWKLVAKGPGAKWELYDLDADRTETQNLAGKLPERAKEMATKWETWAKRTGVLPWIWKPAYGE